MNDTAPKARPILFSPSMVQAMYEGRKHQTLRQVKPQPERKSQIGECPYGKPGDLLWVREAWQQLESGEYIYRAENQHLEADEFKWRSSIHMPREASRMMITITSVKAHRLHDITNEEILREGVKMSEVRRRAGIPFYGVLGNYYESPKAAFEALWQDTEGNWEDNPWVWAISFELTNWRLGRRLDYADVQ